MKAESTRGCLPVQVLLHGWRSSRPARGTAGLLWCRRALPASALCLGLWVAALLALANGTVEAAPRFLPDSKRTPGHTLDVSRDEICTPGYARKVRDVPASVKRQVYVEYGIRHHLPGEYEVD